MTVQQTLRKWHRRVGIVLALFLIIQGLSGAWLAVAEVEIEPAHASEVKHDGKATVQDHDSEFTEIMEAIHKGGGFSAAPYRLVLGLGITFMALTGSLIYFKVGIRKS
jgi:uncharacterized iron-regulated membrane protein